MNGKKNLWKLPLGTRRLAGAIRRVTRRSATDAATANKAER